MSKKTICLAGGCFWGVEEYFKRIDGVINTDVGYSNGYADNPTYEQVCNNETGAAEAVYIEYEDEVVTLDILLDYYFRVIDPTSLNKQGGDIGTQYRTGIYYTDNQDIDIINAVIGTEQKKYTDKIMVEVDKMKDYFSAEEYHQDYLVKNPNGYCHVDFTTLDD